MYPDDDYLVPAEEYYKEGNFEAALIYLYSISEQAAYNHDPRQSKINNMYDEIHSMVLKKSRKAILKNPDDADAWYAKGRLFANERRFSEAIGCFNKALEIDPSLQEVKSYKVYLIQKYFDFLKVGFGHNPLKDYDNITQLEPSFAPAWYELGKLLEEKGKFKSALACFKRVLELQPNNWEARVKKDKLHKEKFS